jgi:hypothetical protein
MSNLPAWLIPAWIILGPAIAIVASSAFGGSGPSAMSSDLPRRS